MTYLEALESELKHAGIPPRRRARILAEFADHLQENPEAELGAPRLLARQFADVLGTRLARSTACWAFGVLAIAAIVLVIMFFEGGRIWGGWGGYGSDPHSAYMPSWWVPLMIVWFFSAQLALAAGSLAVRLAWRLRHQPVITAADARILRRRAAVGLLAGALTMLILPATDLMLARPLTVDKPGGGVEAAADRWHSLSAVTTAPWWGYVAIIGGPLLIMALLSLLRMVLLAARMPPHHEGDAGDLTLDLGVRGAPLTPERIAPRGQQRDRAHHAGHRGPLWSHARWAAPGSGRCRRVPDRLRPARRLPRSTNYCPPLTDAPKRHDCRGRATARRHRVVRTGVRVAVFAGWAHNLAGPIAH